MVDVILPRVLLRTVYDYLQYEDAIKLNDEWFFTAPEKPLIWTEQIRNTIYFPRDICPWPHQGSDSYYLHPDDESFFTPLVIPYILINRPETRIFKVCPSCSEYYQLDVIISRDKPGEPVCGTGYDALLSYNHRLTLPDITKYKLSFHRINDFTRNIVCLKCSSGKTNCISSFERYSFTPNKMLNKSQIGFEKDFRKFLQSTENIEF